MASVAPSILLVEDDLSLRDSLCQFLSDHGYRALTASTAKEGWDLLRSRGPQLCLLDLNLPDGSGLELLQRMAQHHVKARVIVMTAFDLQRIRPAGVDEILAGWMTKPVNPVELLKLVDRILGGAPSSAEKQ